MLFSTPVVRIGSSTVVSFLLESCGYTPAGAALVPSANDKAMRSGVTLDDNDTRAQRGREIVPPGVILNLRGTVYRPFRSQTDDLLFRTSQFVLYTGLQGIFYTEKKADNPSSCEIIYMPERCRCL